MCIASQNPCSRRKYLCAHAFPLLKLYDKHLSEKVIHLSENTIIKERILNETITDFIFIYIATTMLWVLMI